MTPEEWVQLPWLPPEQFRALVHRVGAERGFDSEHDLKRADIVVVERNLALDRIETRNRIVWGTLLGVSGLGLAIYDAGAFASTIGESFWFFFVLAMVGVGAGIVGLTIAMQSRWQSEILRVRLDPQTTRIPAGAAVVSAPSGSLRVGIFLGRTTSSSTSTQGGTFRSLGRVLPSSDLLPEARGIAARLSEVAPESARPLHDERSPEGPMTIASADRNRLIPVESATKGRIWFDYPAWIVYLRVAILIVPMICLMFGPMLILLPWNYDRATFTMAGASTEALSVEPWSPTGATTGALRWVAYDTVTGASLTNLSVRYSVCPAQTVTIDPATCQRPTGGGFAGLIPDGTPVTVPNGWHLVLEVNTTALCAECKGVATFSAPELGLGIVLVGAGIAVLVPGAVVWLRVRARVRSSWPE